jgi:hypothetical protein
MEDMEFGSHPSMIPPLIDPQQQPQPLNLNFISNGEKPNSFATLPEFKEEPEKQELFRKIFDRPPSPLYGANMGTNSESEEEDEQETGPGKKLKPDNGKNCNLGGLNNSSN